MHSALLHTHNLLRWVILALGVLVLIKAAQGLRGTVPFAKTRTLSAAFMGTFHLQVLIGLTLYVVSPLVRAMRSDVPAAMRDAGQRLFLVEHPLAMVVAAVILSIGNIVAKNAATDAERHKKLLMFTTIVFVLVAAAIPWARPLIPGM